MLDFRPAGATFIQGELVISILLLAIGLWFGIEILALGVLLWLAAGEERRAGGEVVQLPVLVHPSRLGRLTP